MYIADLQPHMDRTTSSLPCASRNLSKGAVPSKPLRALAPSRGATIVEYALVLVAIALLAASAYRALGKEARKNGDQSAAELASRR